MPAYLTNITMDLPLIIVISIFSALIVFTCIITIYICMYHTDPDKTEKTKVKKSNKYSSVYSNNPLKKKNERVKRAAPMPDMERTSSHVLVSLKNVKSLV